MCTDSNNGLGFPFAFGIFQDYYRTHEPFEGSSKTAIIGTCATVSIDKPPHLYRDELTNSSARASCISTPLSSSPSPASIPSKAASIPPSACF